MVTDCGADLDAIEIHYVEGVLHQRAHATRHDSAILRVRPKPIAEVRNAIVPLDTIVAGDAD